MVYLSKQPGSIVLTMDMTDRAILALKAIDPNTLPANVVAVTTSEGAEVVTAYVASLCFLCLFLSLFLSPILPHPLPRPGSLAGELYPIEEQTGLPLSLSLPPCLIDLSL